MEQFADLFTALHGMQTRSSDEDSVCPSVKRVHCHRTEERSVQIFITQTDGRIDVLLANAALYYMARLCIVFLVSSSVTAFDDACV